jgi:hypothetical protein
MATPLRIVPTMRYPRPSVDAATKVVAPSLASPISFCGTMRPSNPEPSWLPGIRLTRRRIVARRWRPTRLAENSTTNSLTSSRYCRTSLRPVGFANAKAAGYEADDFLAAAVAKEEKRGGTCLVATGDRDAYQLASESTTILQPIKAGEMARIGPAEVRARYDVEPMQVPDFIALRGDASDRIPGAKGVGLKGAAALLRKYGSLEDAIAAGRFAGQAEQLRLYRSIATMDKAAPLPRLRDQKPTWAKASALARDWDLSRLADRLAGLGHSPNRR